jgi:hypothetical protein
MHSYTIGLVIATELMQKQIVRSHDALRAHSSTFKVLSFRRTTFFELAVYYIFKLIGNALHFISQI